MLIKNINLKKPNWLEIHVGFDFFPELCEKMQMCLLRSSYYNYYRDASAWIMVQVRPYDKVNSMNFVEQ